MMCQEFPQRARIGLIATFLVTTPSAADPGWSAGIRLGLSDLESFCEQFREISCDTQLAVSPFVGRHLNEHFRLELSWMELGKNETFGTERLDIDGATIAIMPMMRFSDSIQLFAKVGIFNWKVSTEARESDGSKIKFSDSGTDPRLGIGARFGQGQHRFRLELEQIEVLNDRLEIGSLTYEYFF